jgi:CubicO group peptidase (beta-lactamase class C family)
VWRPVARAVAQRVVPGAAAAVGVGPLEGHFVAGVTRDGGPPVTSDTRFDLASLTKVVATLPSVLALVERGEVSLSDPLKRFFSNAGWMQAPSLGDATLVQLLTHTSGLPAWKPLFAQVEGRLTALANVLQTPLAHPVGEVVYSDLGFILLGAVVERVSGTRLDAFADEHVFRPLGMRRTAFRVPTGEQDAAGAVAATEDCGWRGRLLQGEVHDENAFAMGGVAGHAGLFSTALDLARYARAWQDEAAPFASPELLRAARREWVCGPNALGRRGLGWQLYREGSSAGSRAGSAAYGHTGFTGTSLWVEPESGWFAVLLTNRVHPSRTYGAGVHDLRVAFHDAVAGALR